MTDRTQQAPAGAATERRGRSRERTRAELIAASESVFVAKGLDAATIDDLAGAAGYTRGAFYSNFSGKEEVFFELFGDLSRRATEVVRRRTEALDLTDLDPEAGFEQTLDASAELVADIFRDLRPVGRTWYLLYTQAAAAALRGAEAERLFALHRRTLRRELAETIEAVLRRAGTRTEVDPERMAETVWGLLLSFMMQEALDGFDASELAGRAFPALVMAMTSAA
jgi:AcrR family transcriptional regulator